MMAMVVLRLGSTYLSIPGNVSMSYGKRTTENSCKTDDAPNAQPKAGTWMGWGAGIYNNRWASSNSVIDSASVSSLLPVCSLPYGLGVSAAPLVEHKMAYYPTVFLLRSIFLPALSPGN